MIQKNAQKYIQKLGLEKGHNAIKRTTFPSDFTFSSEPELLLYAYTIAKGYLQKYDINTYRLSLYIYRYDNTVNYIFNDSQGINIAPEKISSETINEFTKKFSQSEDYILLIETKPNTISIVTQI